MSHRPWQHLVAGPAAIAMLALLLLPGIASAQAFTRLQVLMPGEQPAPGTASGKVGSPSEQTVGIPFTVAVRAVDNQWNTVGSVTDVVSLTSSDESASLPGSASLVSGEGSFTVTFNASGQFTVSATDESDGTIPVATSATTITRLLQGFAFSKINQKNQYAGQPMAISLEALDPSGNRVSGFSGTVSLSQLTSYGDGRIEPSVVSLSNGVWSGQVTMYRADETSINRGNVNIYAWLPEDPSRNGTSDPFTVHPGSFSRLLLVVPGEKAAPGSADGVQGNPASQGATQVFAVEVYGTDDYFNQVPTGDTVRLTSGDPAASTPVNATLSNGFAQATVSLGTVGQQTLTATDLSNASIQSMTSAPIPVVSGQVHHFEIEGLPASLTAGDAVTVTVRAADAAGNTIPGYDGDGLLSANTGPNSISPSQVSFTDGVWTGPVTFRGAGGSVTLSCADYASPPHTGTSSPFVVAPGPWYGMQVLLPGESPAGGTDDGASGNPDDQAAGGSFALRVRAVDQYFNRVPGIDERVRLTSSDAFAALEDTLVLTNGEATPPATLFEAGYQTISATALDASGIAGHQSRQVLVTAGPYARIVLLAPGQQLAPGQPEGRTGDATDQSINFAFTVTAHATDAFGNPVGGITDTVRLTSNDPMAELPGDTAMVDGVASMTVRLSTGGFQQITATNLDRAGFAPSTTQVRMISSGLHLEAEVSPAAVRAGEQFSLTVRVTNDAGSVIQEINTAVSVEVRNASSQEAGRGTLLNTGFQLLQGQRTVAQTYTFAEDIVLIVRDESGNTPATTGVLQVSPGVPATVELRCDPTWLPANRNGLVTATVLDAFGNGVPDEQVVFELGAGLGALAPIDSLSDGMGEARADYLSPRQPELATIRAHSAGLTGEMQLETALVDPTAPGGSIHSYPNPFHPGETPATLAWKLADNADVRVRIFSLGGLLVREVEFASGQPGGTAGLNEWAWDGSDDDGDYVSSGGYLVVVDATGNGETLHTMRRKVGVVR